MKCSHLCAGAVAAICSIHIAPAHANLSIACEDLALITDARPAPINIESAAPESFETTLLEQSHYLAQTIGDYGPDEGDWDFILTGTGFSDKDFDTNVIGVSASLGIFLTEHIEIAVRQSLNFIGDDDDDALSASTRGALDFHFDLDQWWPFIGGSFGGIYGDDVTNSLTAGVEGGVKWYVKPETFIFGMIEWLWLFDDGDEFEDQFDDGQWVYTVGIGFNF